MQEYRVNTLYHPGKTRWQTGSDFNWRSGCLELRLFFDHLTNRDIREIRQGACSFHFTVVNDTLFFLFNFGQACPLSDNSYSYWLVSENERTIPPELAPNEMATLTIILVSAEDGIIRAIRQISLSHDFSVGLFDTIRKQTEQPLDRAEHDRRIALTYRQYPTSEALRRIAQASCIVEGREGRN